MESSSELLRPERRLYNSAFSYHVFYRLLDYCQALVADHEWLLVCGIHTDQVSFHAWGAGARQEAFGGESDGRDPEARSELNYRHLAVVVVTAKLLPTSVLSAGAFVVPAIVSEHEDV